MLVQGFPYTKYGAAPLPIKELKVGSSYLADLVLDDNGTTLPPVSYALSGTVLRAVWYWPRVGS